MHKAETFEKLQENKVKYEKCLNLSVANFERAFQDFPEQMFHTSVLMAKIPGTLDSLWGGCVSVVLLELIFIS